ncbi:MAG: hypothetical protein ABEJ03_00145 [Candidatus Nanohaloarchaea archaeon]
MTEVSRAEAEDILERAEEALDMPRLEEQHLEALEDMTERLRNKLEDGESFENTALELESVLEDIDMSMTNQEPEMEPEEEREAREKGPREEEYSEIDR